MKLDQIRDKLLTYKTEHETFVNPETRTGSNRILRRAKWEKQYKGMSERMKKLLCEVMEIQKDPEGGETFPNFIRQLDEKLEKLSTSKPLDGKIDEKYSLQVIHAIRAGYTVSIADREINDDFGNYHNLISDTHVALQPVNPKDKIGVFFHNITTPGIYQVKNELTHALLGYINEQSGAEKLKEPWWSGKKNNTSDHNLIPALQEVFWNFVTGQPYTDIILSHPDIRGRFLSEKRHQLFNNIVDGLVHIETPDDTTLRYTVHT